jgi:AraC-like DNA-binding protein
MSNRNTAAQYRGNAVSRANVVAAGMFRIGPLMPLPAVLAELGVRPAEVFAELGIAPATFEDPEHTLPFALATRLLNRCAERTRCPHFSLLVGQRSPPTSLGAIGYLMLSSATVGAALDVLTTHLNVQDRGAVAALRTDGTFVSLSYSIVEQDVESADQVYSVAMAVGRNILRGLCGPDWRPDAVTFAFARPNDVAPYRHCFGIAPRFDEVETALIFPAKVLQQPLPSADVMLNKLMEQRVHELEFRAITDVVERLRRLMRIMITSADCSLVAVAQRIGIHERTLKRQLAAAGTSFHEIRDDVRFEAACQLLANTRVPVGEISSIVGYADPSSFTRAFQRWAGTAPLEWRAGRTGGRRTT